MSEPLTEREPIDALADDFLERQRRGEMPSIESYAQAHPDLADEIRDLFPTIAELEGLKRRQANSTSVRPPEKELPIERLADFRIIGEIGRGGMGIVYEAEQESLGRRVAIKVLPKQSLLKPKQLARFKREAQTAARLHHTHIVPVFGVGEEDGYHFIVMQLIPGAGLDDVIAELRKIDSETANDPRNGQPTHRPASSVARSLLAMQSTDDVDTARTLASSGSFDTEPPTEQNRVPQATFVLRQGEELPDDIEDQASEKSTGGRVLGREYWKNIARIGRDSADALEYAHNLGTLHRDVKPGNLLVDSHGAVWVADFGLAKAADGEQVSQTDDIVGTLRYMAPEQLRNQTDSRSDVYSLGLSLYELVTLQPAYDQEACHRAVAHNGRFGEPVRPGKLVKHLPRDLETIIVKAIAQEPAHRYQSAGELAADLNRFLSDRPIRARRVPWYEQLWRWSRRNRSVAALSALAVVLLIAVAVVSSVGYWRTEQARDLAEKNLEQERIQRERAEGTLMTSLDALDAVYRRFAPDSLRETQSLTLEGDNDSDQVTIQPALSPEHARFLEEILVYYDKLANHSGGDLKLRKEAARANRRVGDIHYRLGNYPKARQAYDRAADKYRALVKDITDTTDKRKMELELARIDNRQGQVHRGKQEFRESNAAYDSARKRLEAMVKATNSPNARFELARTHYLLSQNHRFGPPGGAKPPPRRGAPFMRGGRFGRGGGRGFGKRRPKERPEEAGKRRGFQRPGPPGGFNFGRSREHLNRAIKLLEALHKEKPETGRYQYLLAIALRDRGGSSGSQDFQRAVTLLEDLAGRFKSQPDYRFALVETWSRAGEPANAKNDAELREAEQLLKRAVNSAAELTAKHSHVAEFTLSYAHAAHRLASVYDRIEVDIRKSEGIVDDSQRKEWRAGSRKWHKLADDLMTRLVQRHPDVVANTFWLAKFRTARVRFQMSVDSAMETRPLMTSLIAALKNVPDRHPGRRFVEMAIAGTLHDLARILVRDGHNAAAARVMEQYHDVLPQRGRGRPKRPPRRPLKK